MDTKETILKEVRFLAGLRDDLKLALTDMLNNITEIEIRINVLHSMIDGNEKAYVSPQGEYLSRPSKAVEEHLLSGHLIRAIKLYREQNPSCSLLNAKLVCEAHRSNMERG